jgi:hypothetical protein
MPVCTHTDSLTRPCGHGVHVGTCPACQRFQLERWRMQLLESYPPRRPTGTDRDAGRG